MAIDTAVHHQGRVDDGAVLVALGKQFGAQGNFKGAGDFEIIDAVGADAVFFDFGREGIPRLVDDIPVLAGLNKSDARFCLACCRGGLVYLQHP